MMGGWILMGDTRRGMGDTRRGMADTRRGMGEYKKGDEGYKKGDDGISTSWKFGVIGVGAGFDRGKS